MKLKLALYRTTTGATLVSQFNEPEHTWLHSNEVRITDIVEVDFPQRTGEEIQTDIELIRTQALAKIRALEGESA